MVRVRRTAASLTGVIAMVHTRDGLVAYHLSTTELAGRDYVPLAQQALDEWNDTSAPITFFVTTSVNRDVLVGGLYYGEDLPYNGIAGPHPECYEDYGGIFPVRYTYARLNKSFTDAMPSSRVRYIFEHELGHILGLAHPGGASACSAVPPAVMLPSNIGYLQCGYLGVRQDDVNGVNAVF